MILSFGTYKYWWSTWRGTAGSLEERQATAMPEAAAAAASGNAPAERARELLAVYSNAFSAAHPEEAAAAAGATTHAGWEPAEQWQRLALLDPATRSEYHICFPLELTSSDYVRRVLVTVGQVLHTIAILLSMPRVPFLVHIFIISYFHIFIFECQTSTRCF